MMCVPEGLVPCCRRGNEQQRAPCTSTHFTRVAFRFIGLLLAQLAKCKASTQRDSHINVNPALCLTAALSTCHRITELHWLEKPSESTESNHQPKTTMAPSTMAT